MEGDTVIKEMVGSLVFDALIELKTNDWNCSYSFCYGTKKLFFVNWRTMDLLSNSHIPYSNNDIGKIQKKEAKIC